LTTLSISPCTDIDISDEDLDHLFSFWPLLKHFRLDDEALTPAPPARLTLQGLHDALRHVPQLESLSIRFDGLMIPNDDVRPHSSLASWNVQSFSLGPGNKLIEWVQANYPVLARFKAFSHYARGVRHIYLDDDTSVDDEDREEIDALTESAVMLDRWNDVCTFVRSKGLAPRAEHYSQIYHAL
jgi:hypothetical protein